jgi:hypothetical protein
VRGVAILAMLVTSATAKAGEPANLPDWKPGPSGDLAFQTSSFLRATAYPHPDRVAPELNPSGAYSPVNRAWDRTHQGPWYIEQQRYAFDAVVAGLAYGRQDLIERGRTIFDWGFRQEQPDGGFDCADAFHSASFFIEAAAHATLLLKASPMKAANQPWVDAIKPKLARAAHWMTDPKNEGKGREHDRPYTHRNYLDADALGETGVLVGDPALIARSRDYVAEGLARQDPSGFNPEKNGFDTSYHAVSLMFAVTYYDLVATDAQRAAMGPMIENGLKWLKARLRPDATVDQSGNTRTGAGQERGRNGTLKTMSYGSAYRAAYAWAMITRNTSWAAFAATLAHGDQVERDQRRAARPKQSRSRP